MTAAERREAQVQAVNDAVQALQRDGGWQRWLQARRNFRRYSLRNQLLIACQRPDATQVMGFRPWLKFGRCVTKGEKAIRILAPMPVKARNPITGEVALDELGRPKKKLIFGLVPVFDIAQTHEIEVDDPLPFEPPAAPPMVGDEDDAATAILRLTRWIDELGWTLRTEPDEGQDYGGWCKAGDPVEVCVVDRGNRLEQLRVLVHECCHGLGVTSASHGRANAEVIVEAATCVVLQGLGVESTQSIPYIAGWGHNASGSLLDHLAAIDAVARQLEDALAPADPVPA